MEMQGRRRLYHTFRQIANSREKPSHLKTVKNERAYQKSRYARRLKICDIAARVLFPEGLKVSTSGCRTLGKFSFEGRKSDTKKSRRRSGPDLARGQCLNQRAYAEARGILDLYADALGILGPNTLRILSRFQSHPGRLSSSLMRYGDSVPSLYAFS